jgi:acyl-coenzyme A synthetase/AMP-(fatty) acid ligase
VNRIHDLERHGDAIAVRTPDGCQLSYRELAASADRLADGFPKQRSVGLILCRNRPGTLIAYLAALRHDQVALLVDAALPVEQRDRLLDLYRAEWLVDEAGTLGLTGRSGSTPDPRAALLLSTSGSTGSPKQVVLSADNLDANAAAIAEYLQIGADERPITTLPFQYSYGLSVINSHLLIGATLLMTEDALTTREFWDFFKDAGATSLAGVPTLYEMLQRLRLERMDLPTLRTLTQAGGRLGEERVRHFAALARERGWRFFVMYGQTEATARMAYLPPEQAEAYPDCIGWAIPGGAFRLVAADGSAIKAEETEGELVYQGPNVMQGYACDRDDLSSLTPLEELHTGDLAVRNNAGLYRVTGRLKRIIKLYGHRVALDEVEQAYLAAGHEVICAGDDNHLVIGHRAGDTADALIAFAAQRLRVPAAAVRCVELQDWPTTESGKIAYHKLAELA